ncbi:MAG: hypothetical protein A2Y93_03285 [Chloroflexi bacterium RBG_13_68_17]|nr:MAG: hypothetical protein A2Y93_03285 [Chloroflexi bacterium RBG_13_68_17]
MHLPVFRTRWIPVALLSGLLLSACGGALPPVTLESGAVVGVTAKAEFVGTVDAMSDTAWTVSGQAVLINASTEIHDGISVGDLVKVEASVSDDGTVTALEIRLERSGGEDTAAALPGEEIEFFGTVEAVADDSWTIQGVAFAITAQTEIKGALAVGDFVKVHATVGADGAFTAREIELAEGTELTRGQGQAEFTATVETIDAEAWTIGGMTVLVTVDTEIKDSIVLGDLVKVHVFVAPDGTLTAREIELEHADDPASGQPGEEIEFYGVVESMAGETWTIQGRTLTVNTQTELQGTIGVGDFVKVHALVGTDGSLTAREIEKASDDDSEDSDSEDGSHDGQQDDDSGDDDNSGSDDSGGGD